MMVHIAFIDLKCGEQCCMEPVFALAMNYAQKHSQTGALSWFVRRYWTINASHVVIFLFIVPQQTANLNSALTPAS